MAVVTINITIILVITRYIEVTIVVVVAAVAVVVPVVASLVVFVGEFLIVADTFIVAAVCWISRLKVMLPFTSGLCSYREIIDKYVNRAACFNLCALHVCLLVCVHCSVTPLVHLVLTCTHVHSYTYTCPHRHTHTHMSPHE